MTSFYNQYFLVCRIRKIAFKVPPKIDYSHRFDGKQCLHAKFRVSLTLGGSEFLIDDRNITGNCSSIDLGMFWIPLALIYAKQNSLIMNNGIILFIAI